MFDAAILGFGTVGSGVLEVTLKNSDKITLSAGTEIRVKYILDVRDFSQSPYSNLITNDFSTIESDEDVKVVVETIGGVGAAYEFTKRSLLAGKSVVTSNKELVAKHGYELLKLARENKVNYLFEASVGGGIPIIRPINQCLAANRIDEIYGILNGTTNYILTEMINNGVSFETALGDAQQKGYAEQNPAADVDGIDACRKICILSALCFGRQIDPDTIKTEGIRNVTGADVKLAYSLGCKIKLLGRAVLTGGQAAAYVAPHLVGKDNLLSGVEGVMNGIVVRGNAIGDVMFYGAGAGKMPTASAVVADMIDAARHVREPRGVNWDMGGEDYVIDSDTCKTAWFIKTREPREKITSVFGDVTFSPGNEEVYAFITKPMSKSELDNLQVSALSAYRLLG